VNYQHVSRPKDVGPSLMTELKVYLGINHARRLWFEMTAKNSSENEKIRTND
jgi:hypothetical protein